MVLVIDDDASVRSALRDLFESVGLRGHRVRIGPGISAVRTTFCFVDKKIFQNVLPVCWGERFFVDSAMNQAARKFGVRTHTNKLVA